jgi:hypothetical protein
MNSKAARLLPMRMLMGPNSRHHLIAGAVWLVGAALGGTFVLGCGGGFSGSSFNNLPTQEMAIATNGQIRLYKVSDATAASGPAPTPEQTITAANVLSVAFDFNKNLYYLANNGTAGSAATFYSCPAPAMGGTYTCAAVGGSIAGGQWLAVDHALTVYATSLTATGTIVSFPAASGPPVTPTVVYTSTSLPVSYGGLAVDSSGTLYVTEQPTAGNNGETLYKCTITCRNASSGQADISSQVLGTSTHSFIGGPLAIGSNGSTLYAGAANSAILSPATLPVVFICVQQGAGGQICRAVSVTFPLQGGVDSPYVATVGVAPDVNGNVFDALLLTNFNDNTAVIGPAFFGHTSADALFACSSNPATCPVNQLPSVPVNSASGSVPYGLAISP